MSLSIESRVTLNSGVGMPWLGFGTFGLEDGNPVRRSVGWALDAGYRSLDTASMYGNERGVGRAVRESGIPRDEVFVTTKVWNSDQGYDRTLRAFDASIDRLGLDRVDLYLIHWPVKGRYRDTWRALERIYGEGRARSIGVSNFLVHHLEDLLEVAQIVPAVNQIEFHPRLVQQDLLDYCAGRGIRVEAWSPVMRGRIAGIPELGEIGRQYGKTPAQIALRWDLQKGVATIPKSSRRERIEENADIFDFELTGEEMEAIDRLDRGERTGPDPDRINF